MSTEKTMLPQASFPTPENTPVPGGGRWSWNAVLGAWTAVDESAAAPQQPPVTPETEPTPE